jgi:hypothetical protein
MGTGTRVIVIDIDDGKLPSARCAGASFGLLNQFLRLSNFCLRSELEFRDLRR